MKHQLINGQMFTNSRDYCTYQHPSRSFYNKLKNDYCKRRGYIMCDAWLNYQNFAIFWDNNIKEGQKPKLNQKCKIIDKDSIQIIDVFPRKTYNYIK